MNKGQRARKKTLRNKVLDHHVLYEYNGLTHKQDEITVPIYHNEHYIVTLLQRRGRYISKGFIRVLQFFIWRYSDSAVDLSAKAINGDKKCEGQNKEQGDAKCGNGK